MNRILKLAPFYFASFIVLTACNNTADRTGKDATYERADSTGQHPEITSSEDDQKDLDRLNKSVMDSVAPQTFSSSAAAENSKDSVHQFIRTADLKFSVPDVVTATYAIENTVKRFNGFVTCTALTGTIDDKTTVAVSADSSLETSHVTVANDIKLRIPNTMLDTTLQSIASLVDFLDYRVIKADDAALQLLSNKLSQNRISKNIQRLTAAIDNRGKKLGETTAAEESLLQKQEQSDGAKISNLALREQIAYSTVTIAIYQRQGIKSVMVANTKVPEPYTPGLGGRLRSALQTGWHVVENFLVFLTQIWSLILMILIAWMLYRKWGAKIKKGLSGL